MFESAWNATDSDTVEYSRTALSWLSSRGLAPSRKPGVAALDIEVPAVFFSPGVWGVWALVVGEGDPHAIGSRAAGGYLTDNFRRILHEHLLLLSPTLSLRSVEPAVDVLVGAFLDISSGHIEGFLAGQYASTVCARLLPRIAETKILLASLVRPLVKRLSSSKDAFDKAEWKRTQKFLFRSRVCESSSSSSSEDDFKEVSIIPDGKPPPKPPVPAPLSNQSKASRRRERRQKLRDGSVKDGFAAFDTGVEPKEEKDGGEAGGDKDGGADGGAAADATGNGTDGAAANAGAKTGAKAGAAASTAAKSAAANLRALAKPKPRVRRVVVPAKGRGGGGGGGGARGAKKPPPKPAKKRGPAKFGRK